MCHGSLYDPYGHHIGFVDNFYTKLGSVKMNLELEDGRTFQFNPGDLLRDRQGDWHIRKLEESVLNSMHWVDRVMEEATKKKEETNMTAASIKNVIFNPPATIVFWTDGGKTVVKCYAKDEFDPEKGLAMAIAKRCASNSDDFYKEIKTWIEKSEYKCPSTVISPDRSANQDVLKKYVFEANKDLKDFIVASANGNNVTMLLKMAALTANLAILEEEVNK